MRCIAKITLTALSALGLTAANANAQVSIRAPFVRVETGGGGTYVRAPFVNLFVPSGPPIVYLPPGQVIGPPLQQVPPYQILPARPLVPEGQVPPAVAPVPVPNNNPASNNNQGRFAPPQPKPIPDDGDAPPPAVEAGHPTLDQFARNFQPKSGSYEITLINPVTKQPTEVRFLLPEGRPEVRWGQTYVLYEYGNRRFVRIEFDRDGAQVLSR